MNGKAGTLSDRVKILTIELPDLEFVGPAKPVGVLPAEPVARLRKIPLQRLASHYRARGLAVKNFSARRTYSCSCIYAYHRPSMLPIIDRYESVLIEHGWPTDPDRLIQVIARRQLPLDHPLCPLIDELFGDTARMALSLEERRQKTVKFWERIKRSEAEWAMLKEKYGPL